MERRVTNAWAAAAGAKGLPPEVAAVAGEGEATLLVLESLPLPERPRAVGVGRSLRLDLPGFRLNMPPTALAVYDGLVARFSVGEARPGVVSAAAALEREADWRVHLVPGVPARTVVAVDRGVLRGLLAGRTVALDPGHGGRDAGARGPVNLREKDVALDLAARLAGLLRQAGATVLLTREDDRGVPEEHRRQVLAGPGVDCALRLHTGHGGDRRRGVRTLAHGRQAARLAAAVHRRLLEKLALPDRGVGLAPGAGGPPAPVPTVTVEAVCLRNGVDEALLRSPVFKQRLAQALFNGLADYLSPAPDGGAAARWVPCVRAPGGRPPGAARIPLRTHVLGRHDDMVAVVRRYALPVARPGDVVAVAESALAITQGRAFPCERVRPRVLARVLCRFPDPEGSLATPAAMELALREAGTPRVLLGAAAAALGRLAGRRGDFYRVAGRQLAQIDDIGGTMPPYEACIVLGPRDPQGAAEAIRAATGLDAVVADVNDLRRVDVLGHTGPHAPETLARWLEDNPFGNDDQQTPLVLIRPAPRGG